MWFKIFFKVNQMSGFIYTLVAILGIITTANMLYHFIISLFAWKKPTKKNISDSKKNLAVIICAHNEENVISDTLIELKKSDYPTDLYDIFVVADNCTDKTALISKEAGITVWERVNLLEKGKGYTLKWAFQKLFSLPKNYDAFVIIDADNIVHKDFLKEIAISLEDGAMAVQGYIAAKNPYSSWVSVSYHITHLCLNKLYQKARDNIDFPVWLNGTGFAIKTDILKNIFWNPDCLSEDMELTAQMSLLGILVSYNENAIVYDEKPIDFITSYKQRVRWMQGQSDVFSRYALPLLKKKKFDSLIFLFQPYMFVLTGILAILSLFVPVNFGAIIYGIIQFLAVPLYLLIIKELNFKILKCYIPYLFFLYSWIPISFMGIIKRKNKDWFHTKHTITVRKGS